MISFVSFAFISALSFKISFLLLTLGFFISSFSSSLGVELGYLFYFFLVSWGMPVLLWTFPLELLLQCPTGFGQSLNNRFISHSHLSLVDKGLCSTLTFREVSRWSFPPDVGEGIVRPIRLWFLKASILKSYVTTTQTPLANVTSMVMANLGLVGTQRAG